MCRPKKVSPLRYMDNSLAAYLPVLIQIAIGVALPAGILAASHIFGQRGRHNAAKDSPYECGNTLPADDRPHPRFAVKFYVTAMLFILFNIALIFLLPFALVCRELAAAGLAVAAPICVFLAVLALGLFYQIRSGALDWDTPNNH
ncbi:MAG: NADH-quinone oxidoreductase subunit A [Puniceicoccales bacterium]|jgi:NADH-quinone oxidoreductase subunit A|nr:NADH-quinone oxidoreductase subunit A [Puniceicoccales bacterium]